MVTAELGEGLDEARARRERPGVEQRAGAVARHPPVLDALGAEERLRADLVGHRHLRQARDRPG